MAISIHALLAESDRHRKCAGPPAHRFLSTLSLRRATSEQGPASAGLQDFYPRSPCGERRSPGVQPDTPAPISIHALLAESDPCETTPQAAPQTFLSTLSLRRATLWTSSRRPCISDFYPRSPCGERQPCGVDGGDFDDYFYPRSPCGERPRAERERAIRMWHFYPRSPCGERPGTVATIARCTKISIHALLAESDAMNAYYRKHKTLFLSTLSLRRAT